MTRWLLLAALLCAGCDDESLPAKVAAAQLHGIVAAQVICNCTITTADEESTFTSLQLGPALVSNFQANKLIDGSCLSGFDQSTTTGDAMTLKARGTAGAGSCRFGAYHAESGKMYVDEGGPGSYETAWSRSLDTCCTGFNLEAFGAE